VAPRRIQIVLAVEVAAPWRPTSCVVGNSPAGPPDEHRQSIVGNAVHGELLARSSLEDFGGSYAVGGSVGFKVKW